MQETDVAVARPRSRVEHLRRIVFGLLVALFALAHVSPVSPMLFAVLGWFIEGEGIQSHRVHQICFGMAFGLSFTGLITQFRNPDWRLAQMYQVAIPLWLIGAAYFIVDRAYDPPALFFVAMPVLLVLLHPGRARLLRPPIKPKPVLAALAVAGALPFLVFAVEEFSTGLQASGVAPEAIKSLPDDVSDEEFDEELDEALRAATDSREEFEVAKHYGHWSAMGAFALSIIALAAIAALGIPGSRLAAWSAGIAAIVYGVASLVFPEDASAAFEVWAMLAIVWGFAFVVVGQAVRRRPLGSRPSPPGEGVTEAAS